MLTLRHTLISFLLMFIPIYNATAQDYQKNLFESHSDIGTCNLAGNLTHNSEMQEYGLSGSGNNIWFNEDQFHFSWRRMKGDFILLAHAEFVGEGSHAHRKTGWMIRQSLDANAPHVSAAVHGDGLASLQYRRISGGQTEERRSPVTAPDVIQLERKGDKFILCCAKYGEPFDTVQVSVNDLGDDVYAGLFICSHDNKVLEKARFSNVRITRPAKEGFVPYSDYIGSNLEIMEVETGARKVMYQSTVSIQAPNWSRDGKYLIYNSEGLLYKFFLETAIREKINSGPAVNNNNDHVISFDGKMLGISNHVAEEGNKSIIFTMPVEGGTPSRITSLGPSYLHGWSPDGKYLTYTADRNNNFDIYKIAVKKKREIRLTDAPGLDDGSEYSPDGRFIYFNSARTGTMQIWRMRPDGSQQEQLTFDELNNWFPHVSPDGRYIVFLSFMKDVKADDHPFYKHVYIRMMPFDGGKPKVIAYLYGGQGTINVPSWSPDSKKIAFVSNSDLKLP